MHVSGTAEISLNTLREQTRVTYATVVTNRHPDVSVYFLGKCRVQSTRTHARTQVFPSPVLCNTVAMAEVLRLQHGNTL